MKIRRPIGLIAMLVLAWLAIDLNPLRAAIANTTVPTRDQGAHSSLLQGACTPGDLLQDGGFEAGLPNPAWQTSSNVFSDILDDLPDPAPHSGTWKAWMGGDNLIQENLWQALNVPADSASLEVTYWWRVDTFETNHPFDTLKVQIRDAAGSPLQTLETLTDGDASQTWQQSSFAVTGYAGQAIQVAFAVQTDDTGPTSFFLDDVSVLNTCVTMTATATQTASPTATLTPTATATSTATAPPAATQTASPTATATSTATAPPAATQTASPTVTPTSSPTTTPTGPVPVTISKVSVTDIRDTTFTVSWVTDQSAGGEVRYGTDPAQLNQVAADNRVDDTHLVVVKNLNPATMYYFDIVSGSSQDDNGGSHYQVTTGPTISPPAPHTAYGYVYKEDGSTPAEGALVYAVIRDNDGQGSQVCASMVAQVDVNGIANFNLANARSTDFTTACAYSTSGDILQLAVEGASDGSAARDQDMGAVSPWTPPVVLSRLHMWYLPILYGWAFIAPPGEAPGGAFTAQTLIDEINQQGGQAVEIARWENSGWESHIDGQPFNNFPVELGRGYFLRATGSSTWAFEGREVTQPIPLQFFTGWNGVSVPNPGILSQASDMCAAVPAAEELARWENSGWESHLCGQPFNNFALEVGRGYFVRASGSASWPAGAPASTRIQNQPERPPRFPQKRQDSGLQEPSGMPTWSDSRPEPRRADQPEGSQAAAYPVRVSNVRDTTFTVSWVTDAPTTGQVQYAANPQALNQIADDARGAGTNSGTHYATVRGLLPNTTYYFDVISGGSTDDNGGKHYQVTTGPTLSPVAPSTAFGEVFQADGTTLADGTIVYLQVVDRNGAGSAGASALLSALVESGYWAVDVNGARTVDLNSRFVSSEQGDQIALEVQGIADAMAYAEVSLDKTTTAAVAPLTLKPCIGQADVVCDCIVNTADLRATADRWRTQLLHYDVDRDGLITVTDVASVANVLGALCPAGTSVSEQ